MMSMQTRLRAIGFQQGYGMAAHRCRTVACMPTACCCLLMAAAMGLGGNRETCCQREDQGAWGSIRESHSGMQACHTAAWVLPSAHQRLWACLMPKYL